MKPLVRGTALLLCVLLTVGLSAAVAQDQDPASTTSASQPTSTFAKDRLFLRWFEYDGEIVNGQWWEGDLVYTNHENFDAFTVEILGAVQPFRKLELGGRVGFGTTNTDRGLPDGSGATDLDFWGKYRLGASSPDTDVSVAAKVTIPTGDDRAGLGTDAFAFTLYGALRQELQNSVFTAYAGIQWNDDGRIFAEDNRLEGKTAGVMGGGVILPLSNTITFVGLANLTTERFEGIDSDFNIEGGINWHVSSRGVFRTSLRLGITDGGPDSALLAGYAHTF
jgi:hypothetical protein